LFSRKTPWSRGRVIPTIFDLDLKNGLVDAPLFSYGFCDYEPVGHIYYRHDFSMVHTVDKGVLELCYYIYLAGGAEEKLGYREVERFLWERYGGRFFKDVRPQALPFEEYAKRCYPAAFEYEREGWVELELEGRQCGGVISGWGIGRGDLPNQAWFCNMRSGYGMYIMGKLMGDEELIRKAQLMKNTALAAPQKEGIFPVAYATKERRWVGCLVRPRGEEKDCYHTVNASWKCYWLLRWYQDLEKDEEILEYCRKYADFLLKVQLPSGAIPSWFRMDNLEPVPVLLESAQSAISGFFLAEFYSVVGERKYLEAAERVAEFVEREVVPEMKYFDYETFFSCSGKPLDFKDEHTGVNPQNTLSIHWSAELFRRLYEITGKENYKALAEAVVDILCFYQDVWPLNYRRLAYTYGGFGVQNTDAEHNDARQSQFGCTLADFYLMTGNPEYLERGIAAVRAAFTLINFPEHVENEIYIRPNYPYGLEPENVGHTGKDEHAGRTGFDWGEGSALAGAAYLLNKFGGAFVDLKRGWGVGIDGCAIEGLKVEGKRVEFVLLDMLKALIKPYERRRSVVVKFWGVEEGEYTLSINGREGKFNTKQLRKGIEVELMNPIVVQCCEKTSFRAFAPFEVSARVIQGDDEVEEVLLYYKKEDEESFKVCPMIKSEQNFVAHIGAEETSTKGAIEYYIEVRGKLTRAFAPAGAPLAVFRATPGVIFDFEDGTLQGWEIEEGSLLEAPTSSQRTLFNKEGEFFIGTGEDGKGEVDDSQTVVLRSPKFRVIAPWIGLLVGGSYDRNNLYVALYRACDDTEIYRESGTWQDAMNRRWWRVEHLMGEEVYIKIVDKSPYGRINVDDIRFEG